MKKPEECGDLADVRAEIDRIDRDVIAALGARFRYVKAAAKFKTNRGEVAAPERVIAMREQRRRWAAEAGLHPDVVEQREFVAARAES
jgi:isochorismate pyruvate lyase